MAGQVGSVSFAPDVANAEANSPRIVYNFYNGTASTIADGSVCEIDTSVDTHGLGVSIKTNASEDATLAIGIADEAIPTLSWGKVVVYGVKFAVPATAGVSIGELVQADGDHTVQAAADLSGGTDAIKLAGSLGVALSTHTGGSGGAGYIDMFVHIR